MSWGNRLLLVFIGFAGLISFMVYRCMQVPVQLVSTEYYKDELAYQRVIDNTKKANALSTTIVISRENNRVIVSFPPELKSEVITGSIHFYCASDEKKDRKFKLNIDHGGKWDIREQAILPGNYLVKIQWEANLSDYYSEQNFILP